MVMCLLNLPNGKHFVSYLLFKETWEKCYSDMLVLNAKCIPLCACREKAVHGQTPNDHFFLSPEQKQPT